MMIMIILSLFGLTRGSRAEGVRALGTGGACCCTKPMCRLYTCSLTPMSQQRREAVSLSISHNQLIAGLAHSNHGTAGG